jgi:hypothetical protein
VSIYAILGRFVPGRYSEDGQLRSGANDEDGAAVPRKARKQEVNRTVKDASADNADHEEEKQVEEAEEE